MPQNDCGRIASSCLQAVFSLVMGGVAAYPVTSISGASSQFDLAIDDMRKPDGANLQRHCCFEFLVAAQMACRNRFSHSCSDLVLPGDADFFREFTDGSVELLFVYGSLTPVLNLFI